MVVLPSQDGGPARRFALRPVRVLLVATTLVVLGVLLGAALAFSLSFVLGPARLRSEADHLRLELAELRDELARLKSDQPGDASPTLGEVMRDDALRIRPPTGQEPTVRVAVLHGRGALDVEAAGLLLVDPEGHPLNIADGKAKLVVSGREVTVTGEDTSASFPTGTRIEGRAPSLRATQSAGSVHVLPLPLILHVDGDEIVLVSEMAIERYLPGVVAAEMPASWGIEAKKAQAIAARTYALMQKVGATGAWDLEAAVEDQAWSGEVIDGSTRAAVASTLGEILTVDGWVVSTFYSAACAGKSELPPAVWPGRPWHGNTMVDCDSCARSPYDRWSVELTPAEILGAVAAGGGARKVMGLHVRQRSQADRVTRIEVETDGAPLGMTGNEFREKLGWSRVKSSAFEVTVSGAAFRLAGRGAGHGVGLCQWGTRGLAADGKDYAQILSHYYPGSRVEKIW